MDTKENEDKQEDGVQLLKKQLTLIQETIKHEKQKPTFSSWMAQLEEIEKEVKKEVESALTEAVEAGVEKIAEEARKLDCSCCGAVVSQAVSHLLRRSLGDK